MIKKQLNYLFLISISIIFFSLSFPGYLNSNGIPIFSFFILLPLYYAIEKMNYKESIFWGFVYGAGNYILFNYWLKKFDPVAFSVLPTIMGLYNIFLFLLLKYIFKNIKSFTYIPLSLSWMLYEVFKGENLIGYTYGTLSHTMYRTHIFTGIIDFTGTYVLSLLIIFPSIFLVCVISLKNLKRKELVITSSIYTIILFSSIFYTQLSKIDYSNSKTLKTSLIQHNIDSWADGNDLVYKETLDTLIELSNEALKNAPDLVVWSETAFVPAIEWHKQYQTNLFRFNLVNKLEQFISDSKTNFVLGANETIGAQDEDQVFYNSAYNYTTLDNIEKYRKVKLVPFTEIFPFPKTMPWLNDYIKSIGGKDIKPGESIVNFKINNIEATPLICYEDTFSNLAADGIRKGGDLLINMTNDAWSTEEACSKQHLSASVFRSIENRRSLIRVGTGGYTCVIDPNGEILDSLEILTKDHMTFDVPIYSDKTTFYTKNGNIIEIFLLISLSLIIIINFLKSTLYVLLTNRK